MRSTQVKQPAVTNEQKNQDSPDQVVDVVAPDDDPLKWADVVCDEPDQDAHADEGDQEGDGSDEHAPSGTIGDGAANDKTQTGKLQQHQQDHYDQAGECEQQKGSGSGHKY